MENFMDGSPKQYCNMEGLAKNKRRFFHPHTLEASMSSQKEQPSDLIASSSKHVAVMTSIDCFGGKVRKGKVMNAGEFEQLNQRLKALEEEEEVMRQAFFESMEERKKLMNEIYQKFRVIRHNLHSRNQGTAEKSRDGVMIVNFHKNDRTGTGLSQVLLCQDSNPSIVKRSATMVSLEEPAEVMYEFSNRQLLPS